MKTLIDEERINKLYELLHCRFIYHKDGYFIRKDTGKIVNGCFDPKASTLSYVIHIRNKDEKYKIHYNHAIYLFHHKKKVKYLRCINGNHSDIRIQNLEECSMSDLSHNNRRIYKNKFGLKGVQFMDGKYYGILYKNYKKIYSKACNTPHDAHQAYLKLKNEVQA